MVRSQLIAGDLHILHVHYAFPKIGHEFILDADFLRFQAQVLGIRLSPGVAI